ncbi:MAG: hypothetical protein H7A01_14005 [Hahellaceae bacterium]|nr:hypothetical protein [Hahellaceae bacterium]MCP5210169.1 hypothetical protein [Hahellaceae bacterium]
MNQKPQKTAWVYVSLIPTLFVTLGLTVTLSAFFQQWGGSTKAAQVFAIFFAEVTIVIAAAGLLAYYLRIPEKTAFRKAIAGLNWGILFSSIALGLYLFLG